MTINPDTGEVLNSTAAEAGMRLRRFGSDLWAWDGTTCLGEPIASGFSIREGRWHIAARFAGYVERYGVPTDSSVQ